MFAVQLVEPGDLVGAGDFRLGAPRGLGEVGEVRLAHHRHLARVFQAIDRILTDRLEQSVTAEAVGSLLDNHQRFVGQT